MSDTASPEQLAANRANAARTESVKSFGDPPAAVFAVEVNRKTAAPGTLESSA